MAKIQSSVPVYHQDHFTFNRESQSFSAFVSDFRGLNSLMARLYPDACDAGFGIMSKATGKTAYFSFTETMKNRDGDITGWVFSAVVDSNSALFGLKVVVFNT